MNKRVRGLIEQNIPRVIEIRRKIHAYPELGFQEFATSALVRDLLTELELEVQDLGEGTGVVGVLKGKLPGPGVGLRADLDALPILENTQLSFKSKTSGVMHACGHDGHVAILLGAALVLRQLQDELGGTVKFIFQPAEELLQGAKDIISRGALESPEMDFVYALHLWPELPLGHIGTKRGAIMAGAAKFTATLQGKGGHGANPHLAVDPIVAAGQFLGQLQTIASREVSPVEPVVVSVGRIHGGVSYNTIAGSVALDGTTRTVDPKMMTKIVDLLEAKLKGVAASSGISYQLNYEQLCPPLINDEQESEEVLTLSRRLFGKDNVHELTQASMIAEDFAYFLEQAKGCLFLLGTGENGKSSPLHSDTFDFNEEVLFRGIKMMVMLALSKGSGKNHPQ